MLFEKLMEKVKIVIGANWGDEGKGLMTQYFSNNDTLVVCHNGGCQKGHTIDLNDNSRHIFHHFGSGAFVGADTYLAKTYILNPMLFVGEYKELSLMGADTICYINMDAMFSTPYDLLMNQLIERLRDNQKHGSCGLGIFETIHRNEKYPLPLKDFISLNDEEKFQKIKEVRDYFLNERVRELGVRVSSYFMELFENDNIIYNYLKDMDFMLSNTIQADDGILEKYDNVVFEGAQGLALDQHNMKYWPHLTPSNTGSKNPMEILSQFDLSNTDVEVCYVTRSYYTKHGAGDFEFLCPKGDINPNIIDLTNVPNPYQETIKYGYMDIDDMLERINKDFNNIKIKAKKSLAVTHLNYTNNCFKTKDKYEEINIEGFNQIYKSNTKFSKDVF
jgi:adenylosuccinate synthase